MKNVNQFILLGVLIGLYGFNSNDVAFAENQFAPYINCLRAHNDGQSSTNALVKLSNDPEINVLAFINEGSFYFVNSEAIHVYRLNDTLDKNPLFTETEKKEHRERIKESRFARTNISSCQAGRDCTLKLRLPSELTGDAATCLEVDYMSRSASDYISPSFARKKQCKPAEEFAVLQGNDLVNPQTKSKVADEIKRRIAPMFLVYNRALYTNDRHEEQLSACKNIPELTPYLAEVRQDLGLGEGRPGPGGGQGAKQGQPTMSLIEK